MFPYPHPKARIHISQEPGEAEAHENSATPPPAPSILPESCRGHLGPEETMYVIASPGPVSTFHTEGSSQVLEIKG